MVVAKVGEGVDRRLLGTPVVLGAPVFEEFTQIAGIDAVGPVVVVEVGGQAGLIETGA